MSVLLQACYNVGALIKGSTIRLTKPNAPTKHAPVGARCENRASDVVGMRWRHEAFLTWPKPPRLSTNLVSLGILESGYTHGMVDSGTNNFQSHAADT